MNLTNPNTLLIIAGLLAIIVEIVIGAATGFELFVLGIIFAIGGTVGHITGSLQVALASIVGMILVYVIFGRRMIKQSLHVTTKKTNIESIIGKKAIVTETIPENGAGRVKIMGEEWRAEADRAIPNGGQVRIESVSGVTVKVVEI